MTRGRMRLFVAVALLLSSGAIAAPRPKLAVLIVVDQLPVEALERARRQAPNGGFDRLFSRGATFTQAQYGHLTTLTAPGHACIASGTYGYRHGIVNNSIFSAALGKKASVLRDAAHRPLAGVDEEISPVEFGAEAIGDVLIRTSGGKSKVVSMALKARSSILLGGQLGKAYWFDEQGGEVTTSNYYASELPAWVKAFNQSRPASSWFDRSWERALPTAAYDGPDAAVGEADMFALGTTFPRKVNGGLKAPGGDFYSAFLVTPFGVEYQLAFAKAAVEGQQLGRDEWTDLLAISITPTDYAGHIFGPDSHEVQDLLIRLDRALAELLTYLEKAVGGPQNLVVGLTADHGAAPAWRQMASLGLNAGQIKSSEVLAALETGLKKRFGDGPWVSSLIRPDLYLNAELIKSRGLDAAAVEQAAGEIALGLPPFTAYFTRSQLSRGQVPPTALGRAAQLSFNPRVSGDVLLVARPFWYGESFDVPALASGHGSPYGYDTHVPMVLWGGSVRPQVVDQRVDMSDFAPTFCGLIGVSAPSSADGVAYPLRR
jgi:predicted AlkP superfamily pyrophosphatase or phosphodiesterase